MNAARKMLTAAALALMAAACASNEPATVSPEFMNRVEGGEFSKFETQACKNSNTAAERQSNC